MFSKLLLLLLCLPSGGILLLKIYGIMEMNVAAMYLFLPALIIFLCLWFYLAVRKHELSKVILVGAMGGLVGTFCYDFIRVPFMLMGSNIFVPIRMYGVWLTNASVNDSYTDLIGWLYHFSNGITFGIMYSLVMTNKKVYWAILYALLLETIFVISPYGSLFGLTQKPLALFAAYLGHVAYGYPLGLFLRNLNSTIADISFFKKPIISFFVLSVGISILLSYIRSRTRAAPTKTFIVLDKEIKPEIIRIKRGQTICFQSSTDYSQYLIFPLLNKRILLADREKAEIQFNNPGIFHLLVENKLQVNPAFIICEPVQKFK